MDDLLREFLTETAESLSVLDAELVQLESNPEEKATLSNIFRLVHTIKGTCGFLGLPRLEAIAHAGENVLGKFRDGVLAITPEAVTSILKCIDLIRSLLAALEDAGAEPAGDDSAFIAELTDIAEGRSLVRATTVAAPATPVGTRGSFPVAAELLEEVAKATGTVGACAPAPVRAAAPAAAAVPARTSTPEARQAPMPAPTTPVHPAEPAPDASPASTGGSVEAVPGGGGGGGGAQGPKEVREAKDLSVAKQSIRVPVETLEQLINLVSELVLTRNQLLQIVRGSADASLSAPLQRLSHITSELQEGVMKTRMQPIGNAWAKLPRIIRDLAHETGKKLQLVMNGEGTELDRQVLELIKDPLTHMVRNAADHGVEPPEERRRVGKSETGVIRLGAHHEGGHIIITVSDDGRGLDVERIRRKAVAQGLASEAELARMTDQQIFQFVFKPGFSTAEKVTTVSGRGVGMDVVRTNVEKIGGNVELKSTPGLGSTFTIRIPLTLAIVSALIVRAGHLRLALPQICVLELVWVNGQGGMQVEMLRETPLLRLRDKLLPLIDVRALLHAGGAAPGGDGAEASKDVFVIVTEVGNVRFGLIVDEVFDTEEIVVKPVAPLLRSIPYYAGNTILGDGGVVMILDPNGIARVVGQPLAQTADATASAGAEAAACTRLLLFRAGTGAPKAVPLDLVARLEEIDLSTVERSQGRPMMQYRGRLMPLIACDPQFEWPTEGRRPLLVFTDRVRSMGLVVEEIVDIIEEALNVEIAAHRDGIVGSAVLGGQATDVIDTSHYLTQAFPDWFENASGGAHGDSEQAPKLLLVEDSPFFSSMLAPLLEAEGYRVTVVGDPECALKLREEGARFDAVISDIEMPKMNGFEFAEEVRRAGSWQDIPMLALSSYATDRDLVRGRAAGFNDYIAKFDRDGLMASLTRHVQ